MSVHADIDSLRHRMDEITTSMVRLFKERTDISAQIGELKQRHNLAVMDEPREAEMRSRVLEEAASVGLPKDMAVRFLSQLLNESYVIQSNHGSAHLEIFGRAKAMEMEGRDIIHMEVGEPDFAPPAVAGDALLEGFQAGLTRYGLPAGDANLRGALAEDMNYRYHANMAGENILVTPGARFAVFAAITTLLDPGDEIIIVEPTWPAYLEAALYRGAKPHIIHTTLENGWEPSTEDIENAITPHTRMIVLSYPSNPTGKILPEKLLDDIMGVAMHHGLYVLSDEIYRDYTMRGTHKSVMEYSYPNSIVTQSFSKSHAMMGFRIGYAAAPVDIINQMTAASALCLTGVAGVIQHAALRAMSHDTSTNVSEMRCRLSIITKGAKRAGLEFADPDGAMYVFARVPGADGMDVVERCLDRGLALAPGIGFGHYPEFVRISAGTYKVKSGINILYDVIDEIK